MESFHHVSKMYAWSLDENQTSVKFRCKLIGLFVKQSSFSKHDFAVCVYKLYLASSWHSRNFISDKQPNFNVQIRENHSSRLTEFELYGGQALIFSMDELLPYALTDLSEPQYKFIQCVKICDNQNPVLADDEILCKIPLNALAPKFTIKYAKEILMLHDMFMPSKIQLKNAQTLLKEHKCQCGDFVSIFKPHVVVSNSQYQKSWYQKNVPSIICNLNIKHVIGNQHRSLIGQENMFNFHQICHQQIYVRRLCLIFVLTLLQICLKCPEWHKITYPVHGSWTIEQLCY